MTIDTRLANVSTYHLMSPKDINMRIPDNVKKCVMFIGIETEKRGKKTIDYCGTGFIVSVKSKASQRISFPYFVTAKHIAIMLSGKNVFIRANIKDGTSITFNIGSNIEWWFHPNETESSDVALFPLSLSEDVSNKIDYHAISVESLLTDSERKSENVGEGDEVFMVGLFYHHQGENKNIPIIRMGNIAMMTDEPIQNRDFGNMEAYLIESRSLGGLSGSPVFVLKLVGVREWKIHLLGLISGHWDEGANKINVGIAIVAPAKKITETLNRIELAENRTRLEKEDQAEHFPTMD